MFRRLRLKFVLLTLVIASALELRAQQQMEQDISTRLTPAVGSVESNGTILIFEFTPNDKGTILSASSSRPFSVFAGEKLIISSIYNLRWTTDSLNQALEYPAQLTFFMSEQSVLELRQIRLVSKDPLEPELRKRLLGMNFGIVGWFVVLVFLSLLLATLSRGASGFFSLWKAFSTSIREDRPDEMKSNSTSALLIYLFTVLFATVTLTLLSNQGLTTSGSYFEQGFRTFWVLLALMILRYVIISFMSWLYRMKEVGDHQVGGFFQVGLMICIVASILLLINFLFSVSLDSSGLVFNFITLLLLAAYYFTLFLRLLKATNSSALHLFSYLCLSEFITLVLLVFTF